MSEKNIVPKYSVPLMNYIETRPLRNKKGLQCPESPTSRFPAVRMARDGPQSNPAVCKPAGSLTQGSKDATIM